MDMLSTMVTVPDVFYAVFITQLPLWIGLIVFIWGFRLVRSLRDRLDTIEDKLDQLLVIQQTKFTTERPGSAGHP
ncbi:hypothetical protein WJU23_14140 [Prosthecobacter sp. SYSU 5D2]|uniref:hypothetical protein n=1 Tax=Prosthecobacter sp. SYSU 5D2 TaxID=3134134 RepID=UPI0031FF3731